MAASCSRTRPELDEAMGPKQCFPTTRESLAAINSWEYSDSAHTLQGGTVLCSKKQDGNKTQQDMAWFGFGRSWPM